MKCFTSTSRAFSQRRKISQARKPPAINASHHFQSRRWNEAPMVTISTVIGRMPTPVVQINVHQDILVKPAA